MSAVAKAMAGRGGAMRFIYLVFIAYVCISNEEFEAPKTENITLMGGYYAR